MPPIFVKHDALLPHNHNLRVVYFGMLGQFSIPPLLVLLEAGYDICGVVVPSSRPQLVTPTSDLAELKPPSLPTLLPIVNPYVNETIVQIAWQRGIPVFEVHKLGGSATLAALRALKPDIGCVACFARRLPVPLLELPRLGFFNVHPSLLPAYRGPAPLFWTFRDDAKQGVSIHVMDKDLDTGDVVAQTDVTLPDGITGEQADRLLATRGGQLLAGVLDAIPAGTLTRVPQTSAGPHAPWPAADDFAISPEWSARRIFNFMRATAEWAQPYPLEIDGQHFLLAAALHYAPAEILGPPYRQMGQTIKIQCQPGVVDATLV